MFTYYVITLMYPLLPPCSSILQKIINPLPDSKLKMKIFKYLIVPNWKLNTKNIVKKANARMEILRKASQFGASVEDLKLIYFLYIRSQLEQSATVWHSTLTLKNQNSNQNHFK